MSSEFQITEYNETEYLLLKQDIVRHCEAISKNMDEIVLRAKKEHEEIMALVAKINQGNEEMLKQVKELQDVRNACTNP